MYGKASTIVSDKVAELRKGQTISKVDNLFADNIIAGYYDMF